jgi:energy-coupling factor transport system permease protein
MMLAFLLLNNLAIFLFSPGQGTLIYGTSHVLAHIAGRYDLTAEQLFYQLNVTLKYLAIIPSALVFFATTDPGEFASSLNKIGVPYKAAYSVALALRYIPDIQRAYTTISQAQQARGVDLSKKAPLSKRLAGASAILFPLVLTSVERIDTIANAMELRGFGKHKKRTWYPERPFTRLDFVFMGASLLLPLAAFALLLSRGRFYNPFT